MYDVIVIGAGSTGLQTSKILSEAGLKVAVFEKKNEVGKHIICTGIVGKKAYTQFDLCNDSRLTDISTIKLISPKNECITWANAEPIAYVVNRELFNSYLKQLAQEQGTSIKLAHQVETVSIKENHVEITARVNNENTRKYMTKMLVIATGTDIRLLKHLGLGYPQHFLNAVQAEMEIEGIDSTMVFVGNEIAPGSFAWVVPLNNNKMIKSNVSQPVSSYAGRTPARVGLMTDKSPWICFDELLKKLQRMGIKVLENYQVQHKPIAQGLVSRTFADRVISVGEAAGQVKTTTGGGIYFGLIGAEIAARTIIKAFNNNDFSANTLSEYERLWKKTLRPEIEIGYYARKVFRKMNDNQIDKMFTIAQTDGVMPMVNSKADFDWHSGLIVSLIKNTSFYSVINTVRKLL